MVLFWLIFTALLLYVVTRIYLGLASRKLAVDLRCNEIHFATTSDGWTIALHRYKPDSIRWCQPLLLCHGMSANRFNFDLAKDRSLARTLASVGFDVWSLELRGHGASDKPAWLTPFGWNYNFDDFLLRDIPAALDKVRQVTGRDKVFWIGHSMGGMLGLAHAGTSKDCGLAGLVAVGAPVSLRSPSGKVPMGLVSRLVLWGSAVRISSLSKFFASLSGIVPKGFSRTFMFPGSTEPRLVKRIMFNLVEDEPTALIRQFGVWQREGSFKSEDSGQDYLESLSSIDVPLFILAAEKDKLASPKSVTPAYERAEVKDKQLRIFGIDSGDEFDFGHGDILLGRLAPKVVYTEIIDWLEARATECSNEAS